MSPERLRTWESLVRDWQGRIHALALRVTGDPTDAEDATQDAFVRLWEQFDRYDPSRPLAPWVYRVALNAIRNLVRAERVRRRGRVEIDPERVPARQEEGAMERREAQAVVQQHLSEVPPDARAVLLLHLDAGLSRTEVAHVMDLPRTTVQSRYERALGRLQEALGRSGHAALAPGAVELLRGLPPVEVPAHLTRTLLALDASATAAASTAATTTVGALVMSKQILLVGALVAALALGAGYVAGRVVPRSGAGADAGSTTASSRDEVVARLRARNAELRGRLQALEARGPGETGTPEADPSPASPGPRLRGVDRAPAAAPAGAPAGAPASPAKPGGAQEAGGDHEAALSFARLEKVVGENIDLLLHMDEKEGTQITPEEQTRLMAVLTELMQVSTKAKSLTPYPFFDPRVLPGLVRAMYGPALGLDEAGRARIAATTKEVLAREAADFDPSKSLPLERYRRRHQVTERVQEAVAATLTPQQRARYDQMRSRAGAGSGAMLGGPRMVVLTGLGKQPDVGKVAGEVLSRWATAYALDEQQQRDARPAAEGLVRTADGILSRYGVVDDGQTWDTAKKPKLADALLRAQMDAEATFLPGLPPAQRERVRGNMPTVLLFDRSHGSSVTVSNSVGF
jgi:RNA polymerase sigma-70 factor (ECF subfamily)